MFTSTWTEAMPTTIKTVFSAAASTPRHLEYDYELKWLRISPVKDLRATHYNAKVSKVSIV